MTGYTAHYPEQELKALLDKLSQSDRAFATSLISQLESGSTSEKVMHWVSELTKRAKQEFEVPAEVVALELLLEHVPPKDSSFARDLISHAKKGAATAGRMKWINILLERARASDQGKGLDKRVAQVAEQTGTSKKVLARILRNRGDKSEEDVLAAFNTDKVAFAKAYGDEHHSCCFCGLDLTDERSTEKGYGPICAVRNGLPWG